MMQKNRVSLEKQIDDRLYQFLSPFEGNWHEIKVFASEIVVQADAQMEAAAKAAEQKAKESEIVVE